MKVLIIGYGSIGRRHVQILTSTFGVETMEIVTGQDIHDYKSYKSLEDIREINQYDYYIIASETFKHFEQLAFLEDRISNKLVLVEKPLFNEFKEFKITNNKVYVAYNLRFHPVIQAIRRAICNQTVLYVNVLTGQYLPTWRPNRDYRNSYSASMEKGGGVLLDLSHEIDYIQWLFGKINTISAINKKVSDLEITADDIVTAVGITEKDVIVNFTMDYISKVPVRRILVHTNEMTILGDLIENKLTLGTIRTEVQTETYSMERNSTYIDMHRAILGSNSSDVCSFADGLTILKTIGKIKK